MPELDPDILPINDLGQAPYAQALAYQRRTHQLVVDAQARPTVLLVEHLPVITLSRRPSAAKHLLADRATLAGLGIDVQPTDRGGDITYHGPGQLVAYPIIRLAPLGLNVSRYIRLLERIVIDTLATFGLQTQREPGATGVWVNTTALRPAKLCAIGVRVQRNVTLHGLALNVAPNMDHFRTIVPCGLADRDVTSLHQLLGNATPSMQQVKAQLVIQMQRRLTP